jgi:hypothetical protein
VPGAPLLSQFARRPGDAKRASDVVGAAERQDTNRYRSISQMREDVAYRAVAAGCDDDIAPTFQSALQVVVFGRYIIDLYAGQLQCVDNGAFIMAFGPGRGIVHEKRPHEPITAVLSECSEPIALRPHYRSAKARLALHYTGARYTTLAHDSRRWNLVGIRSIPGLGPCGKGGAARQ